MSYKDNWSARSSPLGLSEGDIHIWQVRLDQPAGRVAQLALTLSADEHLKVQRFHFDTDRTRFIIGRGALRALLGLYLDAPAQQIQFDYNEWGKPRLKYPGNTPLNFNLAHSRDLALLVFALNRRVGIDVEFAKPLPDTEQLVTQFFSEQEKKIWAALPVESRKHAFYCGWTRKEAYLKALGDGLARPTTEFTISLAPEEPARLMEVKWDSSEVNRWELVSLEPAPGYITALAVEGHGWQLNCRTYL